MKRSMLRAALFVVSAILLAAAGWSVIAGCDLDIVLRLATPGLVLLFGLVVERWRYKRVTTRRPEPDWVSTNERFVDPQSGETVTVFYQPSTGERRYVAGRPGTVASESHRLDVRDGGAARHS